jgi:phytoene dehydrogenase-like protein
VSTGAGETRARIAAFSEADAQDLGPAVRGVSRALRSMSLRFWEIPCKCIYKADCWPRRCSARDLPGLRIDAHADLVAAKFLSETFESDHVRATMAAWGMHLDFAPDMAGGAVFPYLESMANQHFGMVIGKGGADTVTRALVSKIEASGGEVHCGKRVAKVVCEGRQGERNRACGRFGGSRPAVPSSPMSRPVV